MSFPELRVVSELHTHAVSIIVKRLLERCLNVGSRLAEKLEGKLLNHCVPV